MSATPRSQGGVRALLRKAVSRMRGTIRSWLRRSQPVHTRPQMPVTVSGTRRIVRSNERLTKWRGVLRWEPRGLNVDDIPHRHRREPIPASRFSEVIAGRYGPFIPHPLASRLPLVYPSQPRVTSPRSTGIGVSHIALSSSPTDREDADRTEYGLRDLRREKARKSMLWPVRAFVPSGLDQTGFISHSLPAPKAGEPSIAMSRTTRTSLLPSRVQVREIGSSGSTVQVKKAFTTITRAAIFPHRSVLRQAGGISRISPTQKVEGPSQEMPKPTSPFLPSDRVRVRGVESAASTLQAGEPFARMLQLTGDPFPPDRGQIRKQRYSASILWVGKPLTELLRPSVLAPPPSQEQVRRSGRPVLAPKAKEPFSGVLQTAEAPSRSVASSYQHLRPERFTMTSQIPGRMKTEGGRQKAEQRILPYSVSRFLTPIQAIGSNFPRGTAFVLSSLVIGERSEGFPTRSERISMPLLFAEEVLREPVRGQGVPIRSSIHRREIGLLEPEGRTVTSEHSGFPILPSYFPLTPTPPAKERSTSGLRQSPLTGRPLPTSYQTIDQSPPLKGGVEGGKVRPVEVHRSHLLGMGWRFKPQIESTLRDPRVLSDVPVQLRREMGPGKPLAPGPRRVMEGFVGKDLGGVRVHSESAAARMAASLKADAFTVGRDIFFGSGKMQFDTPSGMALLGHELTHVRQQGGIHRPPPTSALRAQAEEREAVNNELAWRRVLEVGESLVPQPLSLNLPGWLGPRSPGSITGESVPPELVEGTAGRISVRMGDTQPLPPVRAGVPSMELARAPADRETSSQAPTTETSPSTETTSTHERGEGEQQLDIEALTQQVYEQIMRRLTIERERAGIP